MGSESHSGAKEAPERSRSPASKLIESMQEFVREELQHPGAKQHAEPKYPAKERLPTWKDAFWLAVFIGDVALIFSWIPEQAKGPLEFVGKFLPWLLGGLFVVLNDWFRD